MLLGTFWDKSCREDSSTEHLLMDPHRQVIYASDICVWFITESFWEFNWITVFQLFNFGSWNLHTLLYYQLIPNPFSALNRSWHRVVLQKLLSFFSAPPSAVGLDFLFCLKARRGPSPTFQMVWFCYLLSGWHLASLSGCFLTEFYFPNASWYRFLSNFPLDPAIFLAGKGCDCIWLVVNTPAHICLELRFLDLWAQTVPDSCTLRSTEGARCSQHPFLNKKSSQTRFREWTKLAWAHTFSGKGTSLSLFITVFYLVSDIIPVIESMAECINWLLHV